MYVCACVCVLRYLSISRNLTKRVNLKGVRSRERHRLFADPMLGVFSYALSDYLLSYFDYLFIPLFRAHIEF